MSDYETHLLKILHQEHSQSLLIGPAFLSTFILNGVFFYHFKILKLKTE